MRVVESYRKSSKVSVSCPKHIFSGPFLFTGKELVVKIWHYGLAEVMEAIDNLGDDYDIPLVFGKGERKEIREKQLENKKQTGILLDNPPGIDPIKKVSKPEKNIPRDEEFPDGWELQHDENARAIGLDNKLEYEKFFAYLCRNGGFIPWAVSIFSIVL